MSLCSVYPDFHVTPCSFSNSLFIAIILIMIVGMSDWVLRVLEDYV